MWLHPETESNVGTSPPLDPLLTNARSNPRGLQSSRQRPGRRFAPSAELTLDGTARAASAELPGADDGLLVLREFQAPYGVPDLMVITGDPTPRRQRLRLNVPTLLNEVDAGIVSVAHSPAGATPQQIASRLRWAPSTVARRVPSLVRSGALVPLAGGRLARPRQIRPIGTFYAVEMKMTEWRRAVRQCRTYRTWADSYLLVMSEVSATGRTGLVAEVRSDGGGLIIGGEWVLRPRHKPLTKARRLWTSEHVIAASRRG